MALLNSTQRPRQRIRRIFTAGWLGLAIVTLGPCHALAHGQTIDEYQVKAAFLYNFAKFVEWPAQSFKDPADPLIICVLGQDPFGSTLEDTVRGKAIEERKIIVRKVSDSRRGGDCHILFISSSERKHVTAILAEIKTKSVLTVGETEGFVTEGGVVNFKLDGNRVRFEINMDAAGQGKLRISSKLLSLAQNVKK